MYQNNSKRNDYYRKQAKIKLCSGRDWACVESEECVRETNGEERGACVQKLEKESNLAQTYV